MKIYRHKTWDDLPSVIDHSLLSRIGSVHEHSRAHESRARSSWDPSLIQCLPLPGCHSQSGHQVKPLAAGIEGACLPRQISNYELQSMAAGLDQHLWERQGAGRMDKPPGLEKPID